LVQGDLRDKETWRALPSTITHVFHLAAAIPWQHEKVLASVVTDNLGPLSLLLEASQHWPRLEQIVFASSVAVFGYTLDVLHEDSPKRPGDLYGAAKLAGENLLLVATARGIRVACLRYTSLFGLGQHARTVIPTMIRSATESGRIRVFGEGQRSQDFLHYEDAAEATFLAYRHAAAGSFNIGMGKSITMTALAGLIREIFTKGRAEVIHDLETSEGDLGFRVDISKATRELLYRPRRDLGFGLDQLKCESQRG
jgi:nucleoside-diphosphate-sugar epimerase